MNTHCAESQMVLGGIPPIVLAAHCGHIHIIEWLLSSKFVDTSLDEREVKYLLHQCSQNNLDSVRQTVDDLYSHGIRRCKMMQSFVVDDLEKARATMLRHYKSIKIKKSFSPATATSVDKSVPVFNFSGQAGDKKQTLAKKMFEATARANLFKLKQACAEALSAGISIEFTDKLHNTPLMLAARYGHEKIIVELLRNKADANTYNLYQESPAFFAAKYDQIEAVKIIAPASNSVLFLKNCNGRRPIDIAASYYMKEFLFHAMADVGHKNDDSYVPRQQVHTTHHL